MAQTKKSPRKKSPSRTRPSAPTSFHRTDQESFVNFAITQQTLYWLIIAVMVVGLAAWVLYLQLQIFDIYNSIDVNQAYL